MIQKPQLNQKEFDEYKKQNPLYFPEGTSLPKQHAVFSVIKDILKRRELKKLSELRTSRYHRQV